MKSALFFAACALAFALGNVAHSQAPAASQTSVQRLEAIKAANKLLIERQAATLKNLDEMQLQAQQLKFLGKRS